MVDLFRLIYPKKHFEIHSLKDENNALSSDLHATNVALSESKKKSAEALEYFEIADAKRKELEIQVSLMPTRESILAEIAEANKPNWRENLKFVFQLEEVNYYKYVNAVDMPLTRYEYLQIKLMELDNRLTREEMASILEYLNKQIAEVINSNNPKVKGTAFQNINAGLAELASRNKDLMFHPKVLWDLAATTIVTQDEDVTVINPELHEKKMEIFQQWGADVAFFVKMGLNVFIPNFEQLTEKSTTQLRDLLKNHETTIERRNTMFAT